MFKCRICSHEYEVIPPEFTLLPCQLVGRHCLYVDRTGATSVIHDIGKCKPPKPVVGFIRRKDETEH